MKYILITLAVISNLLVLFAVVKFLGLYIKDFKTMYNNRTTK